jgi:hypothetical protein
MMMKLKLSILAVVTALLMSGCIVVPEHDHYRSRWHDRGNYSYGHGHFDHGDHDGYRR